MMDDMRDKLKSLIDTFFCSVDIDKFYSRYEKENLANWLCENGIIVPPCKVGDTVYCIYNDQVIQGTVRIIRPSISKEEIIFKGSIIVELDSLFYDDGRKEKFELYVVFEKPYECDRVVYLTKEQAEQKLKEMNI